MLFFARARSFLVSFLMAGPSQGGGRKLASAPQNQVNILIAAHLLTSTGWYTPSFSQCSRAAGHGSNGLFL
jgi:hypothetical protein